MKTAKIVFLSIILTFLLVKTSFAQCFEDVKFKTHVKGGNKSIGLTFSQSLSNVKISLYDFYSKKGEMLLERKVIDSVSSGKEIIVFNKLQNSSYLLKLEIDGCTQFIGGMEGINLNE